MCEHLQSDLFTGGRRELCCALVSKHIRGIGPTQQKDIRKLRLKSRRNYFNETTTTTIGEFI